MGPAACRYVISEVKKAAPNLTIGMHTHNDLGLATANALAGVEAGASQVDVTINGVGPEPAMPRWQKWSSLWKLCMALRPVSTRAN